MRTSADRIARDVHARLCVSLYTSTVTRNLEQAAHRLAETDLVGRACGTRTCRLLESFYETNGLR